MVQNILLAILFGGVFTLCFGGVGVFLINRYRAARKEAADSMKWPGVPGHITFSDIGTITPSREVDRSRSPNYEALVEYTYTVQGVDYQSKRIGFTGGGTMSGTHSDAARIIKHYPVGSTVTVYYDPHNPASAVLERKIQSQVGFLFLIIVLLLLGFTSCGISIYAIINSVLGA